MPDETQREVHERFMRRALALAKGGRGRVEPNPMVGCVIVRGAQVVGEGYHERFGEDHAEVNALLAAGDAAKGADMYVTLEPCAHHGKTPPCAEAVIRAEVGRVIAAVRDPNPQTRGRGFDRLRAAGIDIVEGVLEEDATRLNAPFFKLIRTGMPYVTLKWAMTLDGKIAARSGDSKWVTGERARERVHEMRDWSDAILVGINTVLADDPALTCRKPGGRNPIRGVLDSGARTPTDSQIVATARDIRTVIASRGGADDARVETLRKRGCEVWLDAGPGPRVDMKWLLTKLGKAPVTNLLVEGGGEVIAAFLESGLADRVAAFIAPKIAGGRDAPSPVQGEGIERMADALRLRRVQWSRLGEDFLIEGDLHDPTDA